MVLVLFWIAYHRIGVRDAEAGVSLIKTRYCSILELIGFDIFGLVSEMADEGRVVTAKLPDDLVLRLDEISGRLDRSRSWIVREAVTEWLAEEQRRHELTLEAMKSVKEGRTHTQEEIEKHFEERRRARSRSSRAA